MKFFYLRHHYLSIARSNSLNGEVFAFIILSISLGSLTPLIYSELDQIVFKIGALIGLGSDFQLLILLLYLLLDLSIKLFLKRPSPRIKYYFLLGNFSDTLAAQYLFTSLFGIIPFLLFIVSIPFLLKSYDWFGAQAMVSIFLFWLVHHYVGVWSKYARSKAPFMFTILLLLFIALEIFAPHISWTGILLNPLVALFLFVLALSCAYFSVRSSIEAKLFVTKEQEGWLEKLALRLQFKDPLYQLEWALMFRNKRTRTNLLSGFILIPLFLLNPIYYESIEGVLLVSFMLTNLFTIQHGLYSFGWESSFFDFLFSVTNPGDFFRARWNLLIIINLIGLLFCLIASAIVGVNVIYCVTMFLYGSGVTIPFVLYRNHYHDSKIELSENAFANYNGVLTGPLLISSLMSLIIPLVLYFSAGLLLKDNTIYLFGMLGVTGLLLREKLLKALTLKFRKRRYHLSQSFKA